jgi:hypothetical protein
MKIIFLDIDGVLNSENWYRRRFKEIDTKDILGKYPYYEFDPKSIEQLNRIISETGAKIVVSSTWRASYSVDDLQTLLNTVGLKGEVIDKTPHMSTKGVDSNENTVGYTTPRGCEIEWWLKNKGNFQRINWSFEKQLEYLEKGLVKNYVILDDDSDMLYGQREHYVKCNALFNGLDEKTADKAIEILNTPITELYY